MDTREATEKESPPKGEVIAPPSNPLVAPTWPESGGARPPGVELGPLDWIKECGNSAPALVKHQRTTDETGIPSEEVQGTVIQTIDINTQHSNKLRGTERVILPGPPSRVVSTPLLTTGVNVSAEETRKKRKVRTEESGSASSRTETFSKASFPITRAALIARAARRNQKSKSSNKATSTPNKKAKGNPESQHGLPDDDLQR